MGERKFFFLSFLIFRSMKGANEENDLISLHYVMLKKNLKKTTPIGLKDFLNFHMYSIVCTYIGRLTKNDIFLLTAITNN